MEKGRVAGTQSYTSYRDRFRPKLTSKPSRLESSVMLLSCFRFRRNGAWKQINCASPTAESSSRVFPRRKGKVPGNASFIENRKKCSNSQSQQVSQSRPWTFTFRTWSRRLFRENDRLGGFTPKRANTRDWYSTLRKLYSQPRELMLPLIFFTSQPLIYQKTPTNA